MRRRGETPIKLASGSKAVSSSVSDSQTTQESHDKPSLAPKTPIHRPVCFLKMPRPFPSPAMTHKIRAPHTVPLMLSSRISCNACSTLSSSCPSAYWSLVSLSRYCCTCAMRLYASAQKRSWILTRASKLGSR